MKRRYSGFNKREARAVTGRQQPAGASVDMLISNRMVRVSLSIPVCIGLAYGLYEIFSRIHAWLAR
jgi:hypothetical protein